MANAPRTEFCKAMRHGNTTSSARHPTPVTTDFDRRVLAYERILKPLIAYMSLSAPGFLDHLTESLAVPAEKSRREQDHSETDDHAESFYRAVMGLGAAQAAAEKSARSLGRMPKADQFTNDADYVTREETEAFGRAGKALARVSRETARPGSRPSVS